MSLKHYQISSSKQREIQDQQEGFSLQQQGGIRWDVTYESAIQAEVDGEPVAIMAAGNMPGASPVFLCVDGVDKVPTPVRFRDVTITDPRYLPLASTLNGPTVTRRPRQQSQQ